MHGLYLHDYVMNMAMILYNVLTNEIEIVL